MQLHEQYRPREWGDVVGQDKALRRIDALRKRGLGGRSYWLSGQSGTGKTTIARLVAAEVAGDDVEEIDASDLSASRVRAIEKRTSAGKPLFGNGWAVIVNEAHGLSKPAVRQLLVTLERLPEFCTWLFTTTCDGQEQLFEDNIDSHPLLSRCIELPLARRGLADAFAQRAAEIAEKEGLNGKPVSSYKRLAQECRNNLRQMLQHIEFAEMLD